MRIANNVMAMNTHRFYSSNNATVSKSAEKLSSGYRVNRAGDDAAGLAISEKMRAQVRGMNSGFPDRHVPAEQTAMATPAEECLLKRNGTTGPSGQGKLPRRPVLLTSR